MLKQLIEDVKSWSELNSIPIFEGEIPDSFPTTKWEKKESNESLIHFLDFAKNINPRFIILDSPVFEYTYSDTEIANVIKNIEKDEIKEFKDLNDFIKTKNGEYLHFSVSFIDNGCSFEFDKWPEWVEEWNSFMGLIEQHGSKSIEYFEKEYAIDNQIMKYARKLSRTVLFKKARNKGQREVATLAYLKTMDFNEVTYNRRERIAELAYALINLEIEDEL